MNMELFRLECLIEMRRTSFIEAKKILSMVVVDDYRREYYIIQYKDWIYNIRELTLHIERTSKKLIELGTVIPDIPIIPDIHIPSRAVYFKVIAKKKLDEPCPSECAICQEIPKYKDAVCTGCKHYYCKPCLASWISTDISNKNCPMCRKDLNLINITSFRARAPRRY